MYPTYVVVSQIFFKKSFICYCRVVIIGFKLVNLRIKKTVKARAKGMKTVKGFTSGEVSRSEGFTVSVMGIR